MLDSVGQILKERRVVVNCDAFCGEFAAAISVTLASCQQIIYIHTTSSFSRTHTKKETHVLFTLQYVLMFAPMLPCALRALPSRSKDIETRQYFNIFYYILLLYILQDPPSEYDL